MRRYLHYVNDVICGLQQCSLSPEVCRVEGGYRVPLCSDKFQKHVAAIKGSNKNNDGRWEFETPASLTLAPVGSFGALGNAGLTNRHANGNNVPILDVAVLIGDGFLVGKDYLNGRYVDVSMLWYFVGPFLFRDESMPPRAPYIKMPVVG